MARRKAPLIPDELLDQLLAGRDPQSALGRISKIGRAHARALLVEAAWAAAKAPGPLHAFFLRIREVDPVFGTGGLIGRWLAPSC